MSGMGTDGELRRSYARTISRNIRGLHVLEASLLDAKAQWKDIFETAASSNASLQLPVTLLRRIAAVSSQVRCVQQECVSLLGSSENSAASSGGQDDSADEATRFHRLLHPSRTSFVVSDAVKLARRVFVCSVWLSVITGDFDWLTSSLSSAEEYFILQYPSISEERGICGGMDTLTMFDANKKITTESVPGSVCDAVVVPVVVFWYYCAISDAAKAESRICSITRHNYLSEHMKRVFVGIGLCLYTAKYAEVLHVLPSLHSDNLYLDPTASEDMTSCGEMFTPQQLFPSLQLFLRCILVFIGRRQLLQTKVGEGFRPRLSEDGGCEREAEQKALEWLWPAEWRASYVYSVAQKQFLEQDSLLWNWPLPAPMVQHTLSC